MNENFGRQQLVEGISEDKERGGGSNGKFGDTKQEREREMWMKWCGASMTNKYKVGEHHLYLSRKTQ